jgi:F1F0 ATPase subunit 2
MNLELPWLPVILLAGFALGLFFYGGLWYTVQAAPSAKHPLLLLLTSFWTRNIVVICGFVLAMDGEWQRAAICLTGFVAARYAWTRLMPQPRAGKG